MPYVTKHKQKMTDDGGPVDVGELTYVIVKTLDRYIQRKMRDQTGGELRFFTLAECLAGLESARADFVERVLTPFEERKRWENGEIWSALTLAGVEGATDRIRPLFSD